MPRQLNSATLRDMKVCTRCKNPKPLKDFAKKSASKDGLAPWCKACFAENAAEKYKSDPNERARKVRNRQTLRQRNQALVRQYLEGRACIDCTIWDWRVLQFDHRGDEPKEFNIGDALGWYSAGRLLREIEKCDVRCANCHQIKTAERSGLWRSLV